MASEPDDTTMSAKEAAEALGVSLATLYAYVSRGMVRSEAHGAARERRYLAEDVRTLVERKAQRREPARAAATALNWGAPVLESAITLIQDGRLSYRGRDAVELARTTAFEEVVAHLWGAPFESPLPPPGGPRLVAARRLAAELPAFERFTVLLPFAALDDLAALDLRPAAVAAAGTRILRQLAAWLSPDAEPADAPIAEVAAKAWNVRDPEGVRALEAALVLAADHELNVSAFTARCVASAGASPYAAVAAGLDALQGGRHGGHTARVEAMFAEVGRAEEAVSALAARLRRGAEIPGFGQPLYPQGDPRGAELLARARALAPDDALPEAAVAAATALGQGGPTIDLGLVALARALQLPPGAPLAIFALGRAAGWIAHALEQYRQGELIRPRARYVGPPPA